MRTSNESSLKALKLLKELEEAGMCVKIVIYPMCLKGECGVTVQVNDGTIQKGDTLLEAIELVHSKEYNNAQLNVDNAKGRLNDAEGCLAIFSTPTDSTPYSPSGRKLELVEKKS